MIKKHLYRHLAVLFAVCVLSVTAGTAAYALATEDIAETGKTDAAANGGGYAVTGQLENAGYATKLYNASNGLPTSDANCICATHDGYIWIGGYSGIIRYDGTSFERMPSTGGLTNGKALFEDSDNRLFVGTNDNGIVVLDPDGTSIHYTYKDGLPSSTIRAFTQGQNGLVFAGSTDGVVYIDSDNILHNLADSQLDKTYIIRLTSDSNGVVYGNTRSGDAFSIEGTKVTAYYHGGDLGIGDITTIYADPGNPGCVYLGTDSEKIYYGSFRKNLSDLREIDVSPIHNVNLIGYASGRIFVVSDTSIGYLDGDGKLCLLDNIPLNSGIEAMTEDYQGNLWFTSSRQGVMKIVTDNFQDLTEAGGLTPEVVNSTCLHDGQLYIGTDKGLQILDSRNHPVENALQEYIGQARIRCLMEDGERNLWVSTYTEGLGLVCYTPDGRIIPYTEENGMPSNAIRCTVEADDHSVLVCSNGGLTIIRDGEIARIVGEYSGISNTVFLTVAEGPDGRIYVGTDGDGIYIIDGNRIEKIGRDDGLTSDVILRLRRDKQHGVLWIVTSNSIEYMKDGTITAVENFPYTNNYDLFPDDADNIWVLASYGVYCVKAQDMLDNGVFEYSLYDTANGLPSVPTGNAFSELDHNGNLYIAGRSGVSKVNIHHFFTEQSRIRTGIKSIFCGEEQILPDPDGTYTLPAESGRIQINIGVLNYMLSNPLVRAYLEGDENGGITMPQNALTALEYTGLSYGTYNLHIQILDPSAPDKVVQDEVFKIVKKPRILELFVVRILMIAAGLALAGLIVWWVMRSTIIRKQYDQIRSAKEEAERANSAKSRFLANVSHEIRTPINTIMGMDEMILREDATGVPKPYFMSVVNYALDIRRASESLLTLINDILDLSKIESGKMHLVEQEYDIAELLRTIVVMIRVRSEQKELTFDLDIDENIPRRLYGDMGKIKQIVLNLLTNAVKYTDRGGFRLKLSLLSRDEDTCELRFSVKDTGIGIKPEDMEKLFSAFERLDEEKNSAVQGTGLGLNLSRQFVNLMGADLTCESVYGEGSDFIFTIRQRIVDPTPMGVFDEEGGDQMNGPYVPQFCAPDAEILVVDDEPMNLSVIKGLLSATKMLIATASSGEECLEKIRYGSYNVVLLDHMMPGMDGLETIAKIREDHPDLPVFALTANAATNGEEFYKEHGFTGYLAKPIDTYTLEKAIKPCLPPEIIMEPAKEGGGKISQELPEDMNWIRDVKEIDMQSGIRYSGGIDNFVNSLHMFADTLDDNAAVIENAYAQDDIKLYTIKVHALKTSARIIGAMSLSEAALTMEDAGKKEDMTYIRAHADELLASYRAFKEILSPLHAAEQTEAGSRDPVPETELADAYTALREVIPLMDYDSVEMILTQLDNYSLPEKDALIMDKLKKAMKTFDWETMEEIIKEEGTDEGGTLNE
ncbi:MAG: response regulator [Lachnospiraceae bacterium]|nr:response regulator [Lachnospiraceae bacterium]